MSVQDEQQSPGIDHAERLQWCEQKNTEQEQCQLCHVGQIKGNQHSGKYGRITFLMKRYFLDFVIWGTSYLLIGFWR